MIYPFVIKYLLYSSEVPGLQQESRKRKAPEPGPEIVERHERLLDEILELWRQHQCQHEARGEEGNQEPEEQPPTHNNNRQDHRSRDEPQPEDEDDTGSPVPRGAIQRPRFSDQFRFQSPPALQHDQEQEIETGGEQMPPARLKRKKMGAHKKR